MADPHISASSIVEADLTVSWNVGDAKRYWYRVEGKCSPATCDDLGVKFDGCNGVLLLTTVSAGSVAELCDVLRNPRTNAPVVTEIVSIKRYSRPVFKSDINPGQCNELEPVEFCQIPECFDFCAQPTSFMPRHAPLRPRSSRPDPLSSLSDFEFGSQEGTFLIVSESGEVLLSESGEEILGETLLPSPATPGIFLAGSAEVHCTFFAHESSGSIELGGFAYFVSPRGSFVGSGTVGVSGAVAIVKEFSAVGPVYTSGSALVSLSFSADVAGGVQLSGYSLNESPSYSYESSGAVALSGSVITNFSNIGTLEVSSVMAASVFGLGLETPTQTEDSYLAISSFTVSACGCVNLGPTMNMRHNLGRSLALSRFLSSSGLSYPSSLPLRYRSMEKIWSSVEHLKGRNANWMVSASMQCSVDSWRLSLGVSDGHKQTRIVLDVPADVLCDGGYFSPSVVAYFNSFSPPGSGERIQAVTPDKSRYLTVLGDVEVFVSGIFVPATVYYDDLGLFKDPYWATAPLEIDLNPVARNTSTFMDLSWV